MAGIFAELPHSCMHCKHCEPVTHFGREAAKCHEMARHLKDQGVPLLLDEVLVDLDGGRWCEVWEAMTETQAYKWWDDSYVREYSGLWG